MFTDSCLLNTRRELLGSTKKAGRRRTKP